MQLCFHTQGVELTEPLRNKIDSWNERYNLFN